MNSYATIPLGAGVLLLAMPTMDDDRFARSVVILLSHDDRGSLGVVLDRPEPVSGPVNGILSDWLSTAPSPCTVFRGGPVEEDGFICLADDPGSTTGVVSVDFLSTEPVEGRLHRIFRGHAGWSPGQLDHEVSLGVWAVTAPAPGDTFTTTPDSLWSTVMRRQAPHLARLADLPARPWLN